LSPTGTAAEAPPIAPIDIAVPELERAGNNTGISAGPLTAAEASWIIDLPGRR
jgi:hypothetical protein